MAIDDVTDPLDAYSAGQKVKVFIDQQGWVEATILRSLDEGYMIQLGDGSQKWVYTEQISGM